MQAQRQETVVVIVNDDDETETCARVEKDRRVRRPEGNKDRKVERKKRMMKGRERGGRDAAVEKYNLLDRERARAA